MKKDILLAFVIIACIMFLIKANVQTTKIPIITKSDVAAYSVYKTWAEMDSATDAKYPPTQHISGTNEYTGFWFFGAEQLEPTNRYALVMTVYYKETR